MKGPQTSAWPRTTASSASSRVGHRAVEVRRERAPRRAEVEDVERRGRSPSRTRGPSARAARPGARQLVEPRRPRRPRSAPRRARAARRGARRRRAARAAPRRRRARSRRRRAPRGPAGARAASGGARARARAAPRAGRRRGTRRASRSGPRARTATARSCRARAGGCPPAPCARGCSRSRSVSIASVRQSRTVWRTIGCSGISIGPPGRVVLAGHLGGEDRREQIVGAHALEERRHLLASLVPQDGQRARRVPPPARAEHRRLQDGLPERRRRAARSGRSRTRRSSGKLCAVPIERTIASSVAAAWSSKSNVTQKRLRSARPKARFTRAAERRVHDELHPARLVEEALEDDVVHRRHHAERVALRREVPRELRRADGTEDALLREPVDERLARVLVLVVEARRHVGAQAAHLRRELPRARRAPRPARRGRSAAAPARPRRAGRRCATRRGGCATSASRGRRRRRPCSRWPSPRSPSRPSVSSGSSTTR